MWFIGDSVTREMHSALLELAFGCTLRGTGYVNPAIKAHRLPNEREPKGMCSYISANRSNRLDRRNRIPVDDDPANDIELRFHWSSRIKHLIDPAKQLLRGLDEGACDAYVVNVGIHDIAIPLFGDAAARDLDMQARQFSQLVATLVNSTVPGRAKRARRAFIWRLTLPGVSSESRKAKPWRPWWNEYIARGNVLYSRKLREAGLSVVDAGNAMLSAVNRRHQLTRDGMHPIPEVHINILSPILEAIESMWRTDAPTGAAFSSELTTPTRPPTKAGRPQQKYKRPRI